MATIKLGNTPKVFKKFPVKFITPDGEDSAISTTFKYRTRAGYGEFLNGVFAASEADAPVVDEKPDFVELFAKGGEKAVTRLLDAIDSWDFDHDLNKETLMQLQNEYPACVAAFGEAYRLACTEGKLGN